MKVAPALVATGLALASGVGQSAESCPDQIRVGRSTVNLVIADALKVRRVLEPAFFGFNLEWLEFQLGLWDASAQRVHPDVIKLFQSFPGAVYRYPGGTNANHIRWQDGTGLIGRRPAKPYVSWHAPLKAEFGVDEYLQFVKDVGGQAWYVANLYGTTGPRSVSDLAADARHLAAHTARQARAGMPPILRWELGNELDRGQHQWSPDRLTQIAAQVAAAVREGEPKARFVHLQQEYPAQASKGYTANRYNRELRAGLSALQPDLALHFYYDGVPDAPPVDFFLKSLCQVVDGAKSEGGPGHVWITEHARVPAGFWTGEQKAKWPDTSNLNAAISLADALVAVSQVPEVQGAFTHSLVASGSPWPLVHKRADGTLDPSATLLAMSVLRQTMKQQVLEVTQHSQGGGWQGASYAVRSAVLASGDRAAYTLWSINRSDVTQRLQFQIKNAYEHLALTGAMRVASTQSLASNHPRPGVLSVDSRLPLTHKTASGTWMVELPPNSVNALLFD